MNIRSKIDAATRALTDRFIGTHDDYFASQSQAIVSSGVGLLKNLVNLELTDDKIDEEINMIVIGALVSAIAMHQMQHKGTPRLEYVSIEPTNEFCNVPYYPVSYDDLLGPESRSPEMDYKTRILTVGKRIMSGKLPFEPRKLKVVFPSLASYVDAIASHILQHYPHSASAQEVRDQIEATFNEAIKACCFKPKVDNENKKKFYAQLLILRKNTLADFEAKKEMFTFENSLSLANHVLDLAKAVGSGTVTQKKINCFDEATEKFRTIKWPAVTLAAMIGAVLGMVAGAAIGLVAGGVPGAIVGGAAGFVVGGIAGASCGMWYTQKNDPLRQMSKAAVGEITAEKDGTEGLEPAYDI